MELHNTYYLVRHGNSLANQAGKIVSTLVRPGVVTRGCLVLNAGLVDLRNQSIYSAHHLPLVFLFQEAGTLEEWGLSDLGKQQAHAAG